MAKASAVPRILQVYSSLARGGAETWLMDIMRNTSRQEFQFDICLTGCVKGPYEDEFKALVVQYIAAQRAETYGVFRIDLNNYCVPNAMTSFTVICIIFPGLILRSAAQVGVPKRIAHIHPVEDFKEKKLFRGLYVSLMKRWVNKYATSFAGPTKASMEGFWGPNWQDDPRKHVIYNGVRVERFAQPVDRADVRRQIGIPQDASIVLNVSSFRPHKRHEFLVQVAEHVLAQRQDVYFLLIGAGALKEAIEEQVHRKRLADHFRFISGRPNIDSYWLAADVFAFPSCNEGFGIVIIEASAAGLKVIAQDIPGVREAAAGCIDPILLPIATPAGEWAQLVLNAIRQPRMPETQRHKLLKEFPFTIENSIKKLREIYYG